MVGLISLPLELLQLVNQHIGSIHDRYQLCLVNRSLNDVFRDHLFYSVRLDTPDQVIGTCRRLAKDPYLFYKIHQLSINVPFAPNCPYSTLLHYCVNLTHLTLGEQFWDPADESVERTSWDEMMVDLDEYSDMPQLQVLTVDCNNTYGVDDLFPLLYKCPGLKELRLNRLMWLTMPADMECIHFRCPNLIVVQLDHKNAIPNLTDILPPVLTVYSGPYLTMRILDFFHDGLWDDFVPWLDYISVKYPLLTTFSIGIVPTWTNNIRQSDTVHVGHLQSAVQRFVHACLFLKSIQFSHVWWAKDFFRTRINQEEPNVKALDQVTLISQPYSTVPTAQWWTEVDKTFHLFSVATADHLRALTVSMQARPFFKPLRLAHRLVHLTLVSHAQDTSIVDPRLFLSLCPSLRSLVMEGGNIALDRQNTIVAGRSTVVSMPQHHLLDTFVLKRCTFTNNVLDSIAQYCPVLHTLILTSCVLQDDSSSILLSFPHHALRTIQLNQVRVRSLGAIALRPIEFITIQRYHTTGSTPSSLLMPRYYVQNPQLLPTRDSSKRLMESGGPYQHKTQSFKVTEMHYRRAQTVGSTEEEEEVHFSLLEYIASVKCLSNCEIAYYQSKIGIPLITTTTPAMDHHTAKRQCRPRRLLQDREDNWQDEPVVHRKPIANTSGGYLVVNVYGVTELKVNGKWLVL